MQELLWYLVGALIGAFIVAIVRPRRAASLLQGHGWRPQPPKQGEEPWVPTPQAVRLVRWLGIVGTAVMIALVILNVTGVISVLPLSY